MFFFFDFECFFINNLVINISRLRVPLSLGAPRVEKDNKKGQYISRYYNLLKICFTDVVLLSIGFNSNNQHVSVFSLMR